jgi:Tol biopolymer transport system component
LFQKPQKYLYAQENSTDISWLTQGQANSQRNSRPSADMDGKMVTFESFENGFNQIYLQNLSNNQITRVTIGLNQD